MSAPVLPLSIDGTEVVEMHRMQTRPRVWLCTMADGSLIVADGDHLADLIRAEWAKVPAPAESYDRLQVTKIPELPPIEPGTRRGRLQGYAWLVAFGALCGVAWCDFPWGA